jgi:predicted Zn-dependent protease
MAAGQSAQLAYSRDNERQADEIGLEYLTKAGYGGVGLLTSLNKIRSKTWWNKDQVPTYLTTHPAAEDRIAYIDTWLQSQQAAGKGESAPVDSKNFHRARIRLIALYGDQDVAMRYFGQAVADMPDDPMAHYGYGLILGRVGRRDEAVEQIRMALARQAFDPYMLKDLGRIYFLDGRYEDALRTLQGARSMGASDPEAPFYYGRTLMEMGRLEDARATFESVVSDYPGYDPALFYLGSVYGELGNLTDAHITLGIYYGTKNDFKTARMHLEKALAQATDPQKKSRIEDLLKDLAKKEKAQREAENG